MSDVDNSWQDVLQAGETVLWQGRPDPGFRFALRDLFPAFFGIFFTAFALFWMVAASRSGGMFWAFGLLHFTVGICIAVGGPVSSWWRRRHSHYSLSDQRAFIATDMPGLGRKLRSWAITPLLPLAMEQGSRDASIFFAEEQVRSLQSWQKTRRIGFEHIPDGRHVFALMTDLQKGTP